MNEQEKWGKKKKPTLQEQKEEIQESYELGVKYLKDLEENSKK